MYNISNVAGILYIMRSFSSELAKIVDIQLSTLVGSYSYAVYGGHTVAVEGVRDILDYSSSSIVVRIGKLSRLAIVGSGMYVRQYGGGSMVVCGDTIISVGVVQ